MLSGDFITHALGPSLIWPAISLNNWDRMSGRALDTLRQKDMAACLSIHALHHLSETAWCPKKHGDRDYLC